MSLLLRISFFLLRQGTVNYRSRWSDSKISIYHMYVIYWLLLMWFSINYVRNNTSLQSSRSTYINYYILLHLVNKWSTIDDYNYYHYIELSFILICLKFDTSIISIVSRYYRLETYWQKQCRDLTLGWFLTVILNGMIKAFCKL